MDKNEFINDICEAGNDNEKLYELVYKYKVTYSALEMIVLDFVTDKEDNKDNILKLLVANNLRFFKRTNDIIDKGYSVREYADVFFDEVEFISEETFREYHIQLHILEILEVSVTTQKLVYGICMATNKERLLVFAKKYGFSSIEYLEDYVFAKISKKTSINKRNIFKLLEVNNLDFTSKINALIYNGYTDVEYFEMIYGEIFSNVKRTGIYQKCDKSKIVNDIMKEYKLFTDIIEYIGISITTQRMVADICNAGMDKIKIVALLLKYDAKYLDWLERRLLKRLLVKDDFVCVQNFRRLFEANNLDFFKMANSIASNGYTLERFEKIIMCKSFVGKINGKISKAVCQSYSKYRQIIEFAGIPFKEENVHNECKEKIYNRKNVFNNMLKI